MAFKEYLSVGKGRDVGMSQIYQFEEKLSQGAGEQSLSRGVYRLCRRLNFSRLLLYYYGGIGHYFSNILTVFTVYVVVYLLSWQSWPSTTSSRLVIISSRPWEQSECSLENLICFKPFRFLFTLRVERGWWANFRELIQVFPTSGPLHFMFHI